MKKTLCIFFSLTAWLFHAQNIQPQVINSAGDHRAIGSTGMSLTDNVGETFVQTLGPNSNIMVTQGFLQPGIVTIIGPSAYVLKNDVSCSDKKDGNISISITNTTTNFVVNYAWSPPSACPAGNCSHIDSLTPGTYSVIITITNTATSKTQTIIPNPVTINDLNGPCKVKIYTGITPNGDGENDLWVIDNISEFPNNHVSIFNRWGNKVFETDGYDNHTKAWPQKSEVPNLVASTYFYIVSLGNGTVLKGWVELIKN